MLWPLRGKWYMVYTAHNVIVQRKHATCSLTARLNEVNRNMQAQCWKGGQGRVQQA